MVVIARDYYRGHRWDLAKYALEAILEGAKDGSIPPRDKGNPSALLLRGLIERDLGQRQDAISDLQQAVGKRPDLFEAYIDLGEMKLEAGNATEAMAPLERAVRFAPNVALAHLDLGDCYRLLGRPGDAKSQFDKALAMDSTLAGVHYDLGLLYLFSSERSRGRGARRSAGQGHQGAGDVSVDAQRPGAEGPGRRRGRTAEHRQAQAERDPDEEAGVRGGRRGTVGLELGAVPTRRAGLASESVASERGVSWTAGRLGWRHHRA